MNGEGSQWPGYTGQCNPEVWSRAAKPAQPTEEKPGQLTEDQVNQYFDEGVVLVEDFFPHSELDPIKRDIGELVDFVADHLYENGKTKSRYEEYGFYQKLTMVNKDCPGANMMLIKLRLMPQSIKDLWSGDRLCNAVEQLIGPDIGGHPVWNIRTKTSNDDATTVPWHQDCAYTDTASYSIHQPTAWIPLLDADASNGCMEFAVRGHKTGKIAMHQCCAGDTNYVMLEPEEMSKNLDVDLEKDLKVMPVKYGSVLFFNNCIPHRSLNNLSGDPGVIRWSLDLRWQDPRKPWGFHGLADGIEFRRADNPSWRPSQEDWDRFRKVDYSSKTKSGISEEQVRKELTFDTTVAGPWMSRWEITNHNRNVEAYNSLLVDKFGTATNMVWTEKNK